MSRTHHASQWYRLSCACIASFTSVHQTGEVPKAAVLCANCGKSAYIMKRYPPEACGVMCRGDKPEGGVVRCRCSLGINHGGYDDLHYDETVDLTFKMPPKLHRGKFGNT